MRSFFGHPILTAPLEPLGMGLIVEDHDLHHRFGKSGLKCVLALSRSP